MNFDYENDFRIYDFIKLLHRIFGYGTIIDIKKSPVRAKTIIVKFDEYETIKNINSNVSIVSKIMISLPKDDIGDMEDWEDIQEEYNYETNEFEPGDRVTIKNYYEYPVYMNIKGKTGTITTDFCVKFDEYINGHNCHGQCKDGYGWYVDIDDLELYEPEDIGDMEEWGDIQEEYNYKTNQFEVGDKVMLKDELKDKSIFLTLNKHLFGLVGEVIDISIDGLVFKDVITVKYDNDVYWVRPHRDEKTSNRIRRYGEDFRLVEPENIGDMEEWGDIQEEYNYKTNQFEVGDKVMATRNRNWNKRGDEFNKPLIKDNIYIITEIRDNNCSICVDNIRVINSGNLYGFNVDNFKLIEPENIGDMEEWEDN